MIKGERLKLSLPWPPTTNNLYHNLPKGGRRLTKAARSYKEAVCDLVLETGSAKGFTGSLRLNLLLHPPDKKRRDLSNFVKLIEDSFTAAGVWLDDSQVDHLEVKRGLPSRQAGGSVSVVVEVL
jgi:crossover junction endodeoxyribonuclease RusA